jgi:hypothetical protein
MFIPDPDFYPSRISDPTGTKELFRPFCTSFWWPSKFSFCLYYRKKCSLKRSAWLQALFQKVRPYNIIAAVLLQEMILYCGKLIATNPELFRGILVLRYCHHLPIKNSSAAFFFSGIAANQELFRGILVLRYNHQSRALPRHARSQVPVASNQELFRGILALRYSCQSRGLPRNSRAQVLPPIKSSFAAYSCSGIAANQEHFHAFSCSGIAANQEHFHAFSCSSIAAIRGILVLRC